MKSSIVPTIGRVVLCHRAGAIDDVFPGIIIRAFPTENKDQYLVSAKMFSENEDVVLHSVPIVDPFSLEDESPPAPEWCEWMPYQKGQAALTESIAKKAGINA